MPKIIHLLCRCARKERWEEIQTWFDYWEMYQTEDDFSFFSLLGRANKVESMLHSLSKSLEIGNSGVAKMLKKHTQKVSQLLYPALIPQCIDPVYNCTLFTMALICDTLKRWR